MNNVYAAFMTGLNPFLFRVGFLPIKNKTSRGNNSVLIPFYSGLVFYTPLTRSVVRQRVLIPFYSGLVFYRSPSAIMASRYSLNPFLFRVGFLRRAWSSTSALPAS